MSFEDYELSQDKFLVPRLRLRCPLHSKEQATLICMDSGCRRNAVLCRSCQIDQADHFSSHKNSFKNLENYLVDVSADMDSSIISNKQILSEIYSQTPNLQKWQDDDEEHLRKVEGHIQSQKLVINEDIDEVQQQFIAELQAIRVNIHAKLDKFFRLYCETFNSQKITINENFGLAKSFALYLNPTILAAKLQSEMPNQASLMIAKLNKSIENARIIEANKASFIQNFRASNTQLSQMTDNLPYYHPSDAINTQVKEIIKSTESFFLRQVVFPADDAAAHGGGGGGDYLPSFQQPKKQIINALVAVNGQQSMPSLLLPAAMGGGMSQLAPQQQAQLNSNLKKQFKISQSGKAMQLTNMDVLATIKPIKKFGLEIPVCSLAALSDSLFALISVNDSRLKIFESAARKMHTFPVHTMPITFIANITACYEKDSPNVIEHPKIDDLNSQRANVSEQKRFMVATASADLSVIISKYDVDKLTSPQQYARLTGFGATPQFILDMQDGVHIVTGDSFGDVCVWNYHEKRIVASIKGKHPGKVIGLHHVKASRKIVIVSDECISVCKYVSTVLPSSSSTHVSSIEQIVLETSIPTENYFGRVASLQPAYRENICFVGNNDGDIFVFDFVKRKVLAKWNAHGRVPVIDLCLIEMEDRRDIGSIISLGLSDSKVKHWKISLNTDKNEALTYIAQELQVLDGSSINDDIATKNKMQIVQSQLPKLIVANERGKEVMLYSVNL